MNINYNTQTFNIFDPFKKTHLIPGNRSLKFHNKSRTHIFYDIWSPRSHAKKIGGGVP